MGISGSTGLPYSATCDCCGRVSASRGSTESDLLAKLIQEGWCIHRDCDISEAGWDMQIVCDPCTAAAALKEAKMLVMHQALTGSESTAVRAADAAHAGKEKNDGTTQPG